MKTHQRAWARAIQHTAVEFPRTPLTVLEGQIPSELQGTLYQNGPGRLVRNGQRVGHWFDGDGAILAVQFAQGQAWATYRYVRSTQYCQEEQADRYCFGGYGMTAPGPLWQRWGRPFKNVANTSVLALDDRLLALWEGGFPHSLDLDSLTTLGLDNLGYLHPGETYSAHPKRDPVSGDIYNFGVQPGPRTWLHLYRSDRQGRLRQRTRLPLRRLSLIHDFVLAGPYLVFCIPPLHFNALPALTGLISFSDALTWQPQWGSEILVIDRATLTLVSRSQGPAWFQWHFSNGYLNHDGTLVLQLVRYSNFQTNQYLKEVATGTLKTPAPSQLVQITLNPQTAQLLTEETLYNATCEFPLVPARYLGQASPYLYTLAHRPGVELAAPWATPELFGAILQLNLQSQGQSLLDCGPDRYPFGPIDVGTNPPWLMTLVYDGQHHQSELWIIALPSLDRQARLQIPDVIPFGFHGIWLNK